MDILRFVARAFAISREHLQADIQIRSSSWAAEGRASRYARTDLEVRPTILLVRRCRGDDGTRSRYNAFSNMLFRPLPQGETHVKNLCSSIAFSLIALMTATTYAANPFYVPWTTPFEVPPFNQIKLEHYRPAFEEAMKRHDAGSAGHLRPAVRADVRKHDRGAGSQRCDARSREQRVLRDEIVHEQRRDGGDRQGSRPAVVQARGRDPAERTRCSSGSRRCTKRKTS